MKLFIKPLGGLFLALSLLISTPWTWGAEKYQIQSFTEWKQYKFDLASYALRKARARVVQLKDKSKNVKNPEILKALRDETQAEWDYETVRDLSFDDYVVSYLRNLKQPEALKVAVNKLSKQDTLALLKAYVGSLNQHQTEVFKTDSTRVSHGND